MMITNKNTKTTANIRCRDNGYLLPLFVSCSAALTKVETQALKEWHKFLDGLEDKDQKIF